LLASLFADKAVELLSQADGNSVVGLLNGRIAALDIKKSCETEKPIDMSLLDLANVLAS
jgi:hypothetical protein